MRWAHEQVDFEPGGKDHSTQGGSFTTAKQIAKEVYSFEAPLYIMYDFISIKGAGGKISSSAGNVITLKEVLSVYEPDVVRYLFASTRPNTEFAISFDLDVLKIYEDFDKCERTYYGNEGVSEKEQEKQRRIYELSCVDAPNKSPPIQPGFRHITTLVQIYEGDIDKVVSYFAPKNKEDEERIRNRTRCAWNWLSEFAPEDMKFHVVEKVSAKLSAKEKTLLTQLAEELDSYSTEEELFDGFYAIIKKHESSPKEFFTACYKALINKEKGPKLAPFIFEIGKDKVKRILSTL
jgi:lysyl-tRNA synthetase class 1